MKIIVYTVLTNSYDILYDIEHEDGINYYCYTDNRNLKSDSWNIVYINNDENLDDTRLQRKYKFLGIKEIEKEYDLAIYMDANFRVTTPIKEFLKNSCNIEKKDLFIFKHHDCDCTYKEAKACIKYNKDNKKLIQKEINFLKNEGFPENYGMLATGLIVRKTNNKKIDNLFYDVVDMIKNYSKRDQLAIMYCIWKNKYNKLEMIDMNIFDNKYFCIDPHNVLNLEFSMGNAIKSKLGIEEKKNKYQHDDYVCKISDKNDSHAIIANQVKNKSKVLDVGCSTGIIGKLLTKHKNCVVDGIEVDNVSYDIAKKQNIYRNMYSFYIGDNSEEFNKFMSNSELYDYIIFADVLEHIVEPYEIINIISKKLKINGKIIVSIPNIANIDIIRGLINGHFNYNNTGILDSTHVRFFTKNSFIEMIDNYNQRYENYFNVDYISSTYLNPEYKDQYCLSSLFSDDFLAVQHIFSLKLVEEKDYQRNLLPNYDNYSDINQFLVDVINERDELKDKTNSLENELNTIVNSKGWKILKKLRNFKKKLFRR